MKLTANSNVSPLKPMANMLTKDFENKTPNILNEVVTSMSKWSTLFIKFNASSLPLFSVIYEYIGIKVVLSDSPMLANTTKGIVVAIK
ncbi:hypothetical protein SDC9_139320 [bioreactor metagenome]|uniref:Uncharacterized protein n=1 Tax=bioreactor metagenome TaxID=1076179 RepID=A0A645DSE7_9ZZZZ